MLSQEPGAEACRSPHPPGRYVRLTRLATRRTISVVLLLSLVLLAMPVAPAVQAAPVTDGPRCDFDGDGFADLAAGVRSEGIGPSDRAGAVNVVYGTATGLHEQRNQIWHQDSAGVPGVAAESEDNQVFGDDVGCGDFDGDGRSDLAVGVPYENLTVGGVSRIDAGAVNVLYGSETGLSADRAQLWHQASPGIAGSPEKGDHFGRTLEAGDFNGDGYDDVAIAAPAENLAGMVDHGMVHIIFGSAQGLTSAGSQLVGAGATSDWAEHYSYFGMFLRAGDFDGDGAADLVFGTVNAFEGDILWAAMGGAGGLDASTFTALAEPAGELGQINLWGAAGDVNGDGFDDYVAGAAGYLAVWHGGVDGLETEATTTIGAGDAGLPTELIPAGPFARSVAVGDIDGDGLDDILAGVPRHAVGTRVDAGAVVVLFGTMSGVSTEGSLLLHQNSDGIAGVAETQDRLGGAVLIDDFNGDGFGDLAFASVGEGIVTFGSVNVGAGMVHVISGSAAGPDAADSQIWHQASPGIAGKAEAFDQFGATLGR